MTDKIDVKIGTPEQKLWADFRKRAEDTIRVAKADIIINERLLELFDEQIAAEKEKLK